MFINCLGATELCLLLVTVSNDPMSMEKPGGIGTIWILGGITILKGKYSEREGMNPGFHETTLLKK